MRREEKSDLISALQSSLKDANGVFVIENQTVFSLLKTMV